MPLVSCSVSVYQLLGAAIFVSTAQSVFSNKLLTSLRVNAPTVNRTIAMTVGATRFRDVFAAEEVQQIVACYMEGLSATFLRVVALAGCAALVSLFAPWVSIKGKIVVGGA